MGQLTSLLVRKARLESKSLSAKHIPFTTIACKMDTPLGITLISFLLCVLSVRDRCLLTKMWGWMCRCEEKKGVEETKGLKEKWVIKSMLGWRGTPSVKHCVGRGGNPEHVRSSVNGCYRHRHSHVKREMVKPSLLVHADVDSVVIFCLYITK